MTAGIDIAAALAELRTNVRDHSIRLGNAEELIERLRTLATVGIVGLALTAVNSLLLAGMVVALVVR